MTANFEPVKKVVEPNGVDAVGMAQVDSIRAARRRAIVKGLGKGTAALMAASPLHSYATRNIVTSTGQQCTVSGNQSAAVSAAVADKQICAAFHPRHFIVVGNSLDLNASLGGFAGEDKTAVQTLRGSMGSPVPVGAVYVSLATNSIYIKTSTATARKVSQNLWPGSPAALATVDSVFAGAGSKTILAQLYDWTSGSTVGETDLAYYLAAYLSAQLVSGPSGFVKLPFTGTYVTQQYVSNFASALTFFKQVCQSDSGPKPFP